MGCTPRGGGCLPATRCLGHVPRGEPESDLFALRVDRRVHRDRPRPAAPKIDGRKEHGLLGHVGNAANLATCIAEVWRRDMKSAEATSEDALELLGRDHDAVDKLFERFEKLGEDEAGKADCVSQICEALTLHASIEEEIFYPEVRKKLAAGEDVMDEAEVEHDGIKRLVSELESMSPGEELYDARVTVLGEYVRHHVREEENEMFPRVKKAKMDTAALGAEMAARKAELQNES
jgi:hemerythrin superfamily protein